MIRYYIPSDGDDPEHPNIYHLPSNVSAPTLRDIKQTFPLPGSYHFRFKKKLGESKTVWMDVIEDSAAIPTWDGLILAKVSRIHLDGNKATAAGNTSRLVPPSSASSSSKPTPSTHLETNVSAQEEAPTTDFLNMGSTFSRPNSAPSGPASTSTPTARSAAIHSQPASRASPAPPSASPIHHAPEADPFGLFAEAAAAGMPVSSSTPPRPHISTSQQQQQQQQQPGSNLLNFDAFGLGGGGPPSGPRGIPLSQQQQMSMGVGRGASPRGGRGNVVGNDQRRWSGPSQGQQDEWKGM